MTYKFTCGMIIDSTSVVKIWSFRKKKYIRLCTLNLCNKMKKWFLTKMTEIPPIAPLNTSDNYFWIKQISLSLCSGCLVFIWLPLICRLNYTHTMKFKHNHNQVSICEGRKEGRKLRNLTSSLLKKTYMKPDILSAKLSVYSASIILYAT